MKLVNPEAVEKCKANMICEADVDNMSLIFDMFSDSTRLKIMNALFVSELCVGDLAAAAVWQLDWQQCSSKVEPTSHHPHQDCHS